jgi:hypothetical protein
MVRELLWLCFVTGLFGVRCEVLEDGALLDIQLVIELLFSSLYVAEEILYLTGHVSV